MNPVALPVWMQPRPDLGPTVRGSSQGQRTGPQGRADPGADLSDNAQRAAHQGASPSVGHPTSGGLDPLEAGHRAQPEHQAHGAPIHMEAALDQEPGQEAQLGQGVVSTAIHQRNAWQGIWDSPASNRAKALLAGVCTYPCVYW